jgi:GNAT superfamily N-acetyltransferase
MSPVHPAVHLSSIDEQRFGIRTARTSNMTTDVLNPVLDYCRAHDVVLLIARCLSSDLDAAHAMEREGFLLMDTLIHYTRDLTREPLPADTWHGEMRSVRPGEEHEVRRIAAECFEGYVGHYHADERLGRTKCDEVYSSWAFRSCISREVADDVLVAFLGGRMAGFLTLKMASADVGEGPLFAVAPRARGRGTSTALMLGGMEWCRSRGAARMVIPTQITNIASQRVWSRLGFEPAYAEYTFHKWFD